MASNETRKVTIEIVTTEKPASTPVTPVTPTTPEINPTPKDSDGKINRGEFDNLKSILINQAYNQAKSLVSQSINSSLNRYYNMKEDYMLENNVNQIRTIYSKTSSLATTIGGGVMVGGAIGGAIAGVGWALSEGINLNNRWKDIYAEINATNYNKTFTKQRLGLVDGGKGTEN